MSSYQELQAKIAELQQQAEQLRKEELDQIIAEIKAKMAQYGISVADLATVRREKTTVKAKYRDPASGKEWTGRGVSPRWLKEAVAAGRSKDEFLIA